MGVPLLNGKFDVLHITCSGVFRTDSVVCRGLSNFLVGSLLKGFNAALGTDASNRHLPLSSEQKAAAQGSAHTVAGVSSEADPCTHAGHYLKRPWPDTCGCP